MKGKKTGGRQPGSQNKVPKEMRAFIQAFVEGKQDAFTERLYNLEDRDFCKFYIDLIKFVLPQLQAVSLNDVTKRDDSIASFVRGLVGLGRTNTEAE